MRASCPKRATMSERLGQVFCQDFHGEQASVNAVPCEVDLCHPAADAAKDLVFASQNPAQTFLLIRVCHFIFLNTKRSHVCL